MSDLTTDPRRAAAALRAGGLVGMPTETVYGLAADAENETAVRRIFAAKGRPGDHPLIVHVATPAAALDGWAAEMSEPATALAEACWPGPLTLLVPAGPRVLPVVTGGRATVGLRVPAHPLATMMLESFGGGVAAPSANRFGHVSPTTAAHVLADLGDDVDLVLDGGPCPVGVESTIVDCTVWPVQVLRPGAVTADEVRSIVGALAPSSGPSRAAGMLASHYAPRAAIVVVESRKDAEHRLAEYAARATDAVLLDASIDLVEAARSLYARLRAADDAGVAVVVAVLPPPAGLGHAIRDRLLKAAAPRAK